MVQQKLPGRSGWLVSGRAAQPHERFIARVKTRGEKKILVENAMGGFYLPTAHLVFYRDGSLWAAPLDLAQQKITRSVPVLGGISLAGWQGPDAAISENGTLTYVPGLGCWSADGKQVIFGSKQHDVGTGEADRSAGSDSNHLSLTRAHVLTILVIRCPRRHRGGLHAASHACR